MLLHQEEGHMNLVRGQRKPPVLCAFGALKNELERGLVRVFRPLRLLFLAGSIRRCRHPRCRGILTFAHAGPRTRVLICEPSARGLAGLSAPGDAAEPPGGRVVSHATISVRRHNHDQALLLTGWKLLKCHLPALSPGRAGKLGAHLGVRAATKAGSPSWLRSALKAGLAVASLLRMTPTDSKAPVPTRRLTKCSPSAPMAQI